MSVLLVSVSPAERRRAREFARLLEASRSPAGHELESLVVLASSLRPAVIAPRAEFRAALRESLVEQAAARRLATVDAPTPAPTRTPRHRVRTVVASGVLVSLVGGIGAAAASTHALPGDSLYGLKRGLESAQLAFAHSDLSRGRDLLDQADNRLSEAEALAASEDARSPETTARIAGAIADLDTAARAGATALEASYADTGDVEPLVELNRFVVDQRERLADLSALLSPDLRALLSPLAELLRTLQPRLDSLIAASSSAAGPSAGSAGSSLADGSVAVRPPLTAAGAEVADMINALTGGGSSAAQGGTVGSTGGLGTGGLGTGAATSTLPSPVPRVSLPRSAAPSLPVPTVSVPGVPVPTVPVPGVPVPTPNPTPTLPPVNVTPPACVPLPPLTTC